MTDLRFLGDWGLWQGLMAALLLAGAVWALYLREVRRRNGVVKWLLPTLRSTAVFLVVMMLTGPVLHHRKLIGELVRLKVVIDASRSMALSDKDMDPGRKLLIAHRLGLLAPDVLDEELIKAADSLQCARETAAEMLRNSYGNIDLAEALGVFEKEIEDARDHLSRTRKESSIAIAEKGTILREFWTDIQGSNVASLAGSSAYPDKPSGTTYLDIFEAPTNWKDNYGTRIHGYIYPPTSGEYTFWISGDDQCELWLSSDDAASDKSLIAKAPTATGLRQWDKHSEQKSKKISLEAGKRYYIEALHKESTGEDRVAVGWQLPHGEMECPIPGSRLSPFALTPEALKQREVADAVKRFHDTLLEPTRKLQELKIKNSRKKILSDIATLAQTVVSWEQGLRESFARSAEKVVASNNPEVRSALEKFDSIPRWQRMQTILLEREKPLLKELASQHDVELVALTEDKPETLWKSRAGRKTKAGKIPASITTTPSIRFTDLSRTMKGGDESAEDGDETDATRHRMAVLLISDGRHNDGESPLELAKILGNRGVKVFTVGMGGSRLPEDLAVAEVEGPKSVFFKDRVKGKIMFKDDMPAGMPFVLKIVCNGQTLWNKDLTTQGSHLRSIEYDFPVEELVKKMHERDHKSLTRISTALNMSAEISEVEGDREPKNNKMPLRILAVIQRRKMLIVEGRPRWEWRYVRNMFERDEQWEVNSVLSDGIKLNRGDGPELFPDSRDALFAYDLIIFGELPSRMFTEKELEWLCDFVGDRAGGLIVIDGRRSKLSSYANRAIGPLFPVKWLEKGRYVNPSALRLTPQGEAVAALDLATEGKPNASVWTSLPLPHWIASVQALAGTETLAECDVGDMKAPALVLRRFGSGKVLYTSFDESWRWRYKVADKYHQRYWHQLALWMTEEPFAVRDERVSLDAGATTYSSGESAEIRVRIRDENGKPVVRAQACALLLRNGKRTATLPLVADETGGGVFRARTGDLEDGEYEVRVEVKGIPDEDIKACADFVVKARESGELTELSCNESLLRQIASNAKGLFFREENLDMIIERLKPLSHGKIVESDTMLWQSYWWFVPVVLLLALELVLRKRAGML